MLWGPGSAVFEMHRARLPQPGACVLAGSPFGFVLASCSKAMCVLTQAAEVIPAVPWLVQHGSDNKWWVPSPHRWDQQVPNPPGRRSDSHVEEDETGSGLVLPSSLDLTLSREELGGTCRQEASCVVS